MFILKASTLYNVCHNCAFIYVFHIKHLTANKLMDGGCLWLSVVLLRAGALRFETLWLGSPNLGLATWLAFSKNWLACCETWLACCETWLACCETWLACCETWDLCFETRVSWDSETKDSKGYECIVCLLRHSWMHTWETLHYDDFPWVAIVVAHRLRGKCHCLAASAVTSGAVFSAAHHLTPLLPLGISLLIVPFAPCFSLLDYRFQISVAYPITKSWKKYYLISNIPMFCEHHTTLETKM